LVESTLILIIYLACFEYTYINPLCTYIKPDFWAQLQVAELSHEFHSLTLSREAYPSGYVNIILGQLNVLLIGEHKELILHICKSIK
jgi:hypothetical protein